MKTNLIICCAPITESLTNKIKNELTETLKNRGEEVGIRDLYKLNFNPIISEEDILSSTNSVFAPDILTEQSYIKNADNIILIFPIYQSSMPALIKGYIDRVFAQNFAYSYNNDGSIKKLMSGKTLSIFCPIGGLDFYIQNGYKKALDQSLQLCFIVRGFEISGIHYFDYKNREKEFLELKNKI